MQTNLSVAAVGASVDTVATSIDTIVAPVTVLAMWLHDALTYHR